jgi:hypothetical protein
MKKTAIISIILIMFLGIFNMCYAATNKDIKAKFTLKDVAGTNFKEVTITPVYNNTDDDGEDEKLYKIYLPSGYFIEGTSASYVVDRDGEYPFTVYDGSYKKTFVYKANLDDTEENDENDEDDDDDEDINFDYKLMYDYEKKQIIFNMNLDKLRTVKTPGNTAVTNEVNYYINNLVNNVPYDLTIEIDDYSYNYKIIKSGEFYLLISISNVNYNDYSTIVGYFGYNFSTNQDYTAIPAKDIYDDNGNYEVLIKSNSSQHIFNFNITGIDYRRPSVDIELFDDDTINLEIEDDFELDYIITFDGKYQKCDSKNEYSFNYKTEIIYTGEYIFSIVDKKGNRTIETIQIKSKRKPRPHSINLEVHDSDYDEDIFENIGLEYDKQDDEMKIFKNILPAYMNGKNPEYFNPDAPISRAEMVTIFCRLNDLPYDKSAYLKSKFIDLDGHWAKDYISMGSSKKYVSGYKDKTFKPDNNVTRAEFCQMLTKISTYKTLLNTIPASNNIVYKDIYGHWAESEIIKIAGRSLVISDTQLFYPDEPITRSEVVHAINMLYGFNPSYLELGFTNSLYKKYYNFQDIDKHEYYNDIIISVVGMYREKIN